MTGLPRAALWAFLSVLAIPASGATLTVNPSETTSALQATLSSAEPGDTVLFSAGTYDITSLLEVPCGVVLSGPTASPATAVLAASYTGNDIFSLNRCSRPTTIEYLHFENTGGIYVTAPSSGLTITQNQFTNLPANYSQWTDMGIYFDGTSGGTTTNATITNNTFGDAASCSAVMSIDKDEGGDCDGIVFQGDLNGIVVENNVFTHLEEGFHVLCYGNDCSGSTAPTWTNFTAQWNDFNNIHRIAMEMQPQTASNVTIQYNSYENAFAPSTFSMGISAACCAGVSGATVPLVNNNVLIANTPPAGAYIAYAIEWWGNGAQANNDLVQGYWVNGIVWGLGASPWEVLNTTIEGPYMAGPYGCYLCNEKEGATSTPVQSGNTMSTTITPVISVAPKITQSGGTVAMSDTGTNTSIYYTTDGSTPTTASTLYTGPISPSTGTSINAIGMWGQGANPKSYPAGYGYVPSAVVSAVVSGSNTAPTLVSIALTGASALTLGNSVTQITAIGTYSDGSQEPVTPASWTSSQSTICTVSSAGQVTPLAVGTCAITAVYESVSSPAYSITVQAEPPALTSLSITTTATSAGVGSTLQFTAAGVYSNGTSVPLNPTWWSSNTAVASISSSGLLTALEPGNVQITATLGSISSVAPIALTVTPAQPITGGYLTAPNNAATLPPCGSLQLTAHATFADGTTAIVTPLAWSTSNTVIGTVSPTGLFTALVPGTVSVYAQLSGTVAASAWSITVASAPPLCGATCSGNLHRGGRRVWFG